MRIDVKWRREGDIAIASLLGRIDNTSSDRFLAMAEDGLESGDRALLLDFGRVSYLSSAGLRVCLILAKEVLGPGTGDCDMFAVGPQSRGRGRERLRSVDPRPRHHRERDHGSAGLLITPRLSSENQR